VTLGTVGYKLIERGSLSGLYNGVSIRSRPKKPHEFRDYESDHLPYQSEYTDDKVYRHLQAPFYNVMEK